MARTQRGTHPNSRAALARHRPEPTNAAVTHGARMAPGRLYPCDKCSDAACTERCEGGTCAIELAYVTERRGQLLDVPHLDGIDAPGCEMLIDVETRIMRCHRALMQAGEVVTTPEGLLAAQPLADHLGRLLAQRSRLVQELGLTPAQRRSLALDQAQEAASAVLLRAMSSD